ncbi:MAG: glycosyltransferase [Epulopiscium sp.]|nr:glycosyltransferase [Candidatus Epulonipiscium sp.]
MKKVLIFTASTGGGHNQAASCLEEEFIKHGFIAKKIDALQVVNKGLDTLISGSYKVLVNMFPELYGNIYDISNKEKLNKVITSSFAKISKGKIYNIILEEKPDLIVSTHCFVISVVGYLKENRFIDIPFISVVTDYEAHQTYINKNVDAYIAASDYTSETLIRHGIPKEKIFSYGIPIKTEFLDSCKANPFEQKAFQILLMAGSLGLKNMKKALKSIVTMKENYHLVVVCGNNKELQKSIEKEYADLIKNKKLTLYGFTKNIPAIMESSDVIITKPGGLTVSEAIAKRLPMIVPYYIPGQEKENLDFLIKEEIAIYVYKINDIKELLESIMKDPKILDNMKENMEAMCNRFCLDNIIYLAEELIEDDHYEMDVSYGG